MARVISVANQKGGVGKTTTAVNLSAAMNYSGVKTLLIDLDPQGNATSGFGVSKNDGRPSIYDCMLTDIPALECIRSTDYGDVLPSGIDLAGAELELVDAPGREYRLKNSIECLAEKYTCILIDCPPSLGLLTLNAFCASNGILVPLQCEFYALEGISQLMHTIKVIRKNLNPSLDVFGILLTMFDSRTNLSMQVANEVKQYFGEKVFSTTIPRNVRLSEAPSHGLPILYYDKFSRGSEAYLQFCNEILKKYFL